MTTVSAAVEEVLAQAQAATAEADFATVFRTDWHGSVAHAFLFHGNVFDYVAAGETTAEYVARLMVENGIQSVVQYSIDRGITFPLPAMFEDFNRTLDLGLDTKTGNGIRCKPEEAVEYVLRFLAIARACTACERTCRPEPRDATIERIKTLLVGQSQDRQDELIAERAGQCAECIEKVRLSKKPDAGDRQVAGAILERMDLLCPPADKGTLSVEGRTILGMLHRAGTDVELETAGNPLLMLAPSLEEVHGDLRVASSGIRAIEVPLPDFHTRLDYIEEKLARVPELALGDGVTAYTLAAQTAGLALRHIEDIFLRARIAEPPMLTMGLVKSRKGEIIKTESAGLLKIVEPVGGFDRLGGLEDWKAWAAVWLISALTSPDPEVRKGAYVSILLDGPPGTGKTEIAYAIAFMLGWNCLEYGEVRGGIMGETEKNVAKVEQTIRASLPAVLFMDEVDQMGGRVTGGSGSADSAEASVFAGRLKFMEDMAKNHRGEILIIGGSNRPDQIDDAMASRFEVRVPILYPESAEAIADTLCAILANQGRTDVTATELLPIAGFLNSGADQWAPRDMVQAVVKALGLVRNQKMPLLDAVDRAFRTRKPMAREDAVQMQQLAITECNDLELLPARYRQEAEQIDTDALREKITTLRGRRERAPRG